MAAEADAAPPVVTEASVPGWASAVSDSGVPELGVSELGVPEFGVSEFGDAGASELFDADPFDDGLSDAP